MKNGVRFTLLEFQDTSTKESWLLGFPLLFHTSTLLRCLLSLTMHLKGGIFLTSPVHGHCFPCAVPTTPSSLLENGMPGSFTDIHCILPGTLPLFFGRVSDCIAGIYMYTVEYMQPLFTFRCMCRILEGEQGTWSQSHTHTLLSDTIFSIYVGRPICVQFACDQPLLRISPPPPPFRAVIWKWAFIQRPLSWFACGMFTCLPTVHSSDTFRCISMSLCKHQEIRFLMEVDLLCYKVTVCSNLPQQHKLKVLVYTGTPPH